METANYEKSFSGPNRFVNSEKPSLASGQKNLTDNLRSIEQDRIVIRTVYAEIPHRVEYKYILSPHKVKRHHAINSNQSRIIKIPALTWAENSNSDRYRELLRLDHRDCNTFATPKRL